MGCEFVRLNDLNDLNDRNILILDFNSVLSSKMIYTHVLNVAAEGLACNAGATMLVLCRCCFIRRCDYSSCRRLRA